MSGVPLLVITPDESRNLAGPVPLTETGAVRRVPFDGGQAFFVEEGTTNLAANPRMLEEHGLWQAASQAIRTWETSLPPTKNGTTSGIKVQVRPIGVGHMPVAFRSFPVLLPHTTYTLSFEILIPSSWSGGSVTVRPNGYSGYTFNTELADMSIRDEWQRVSSTFTTGDGTTGSIGGGWLDAVEDDWFYVTEPQLEEKPYATSFVHGDMGDGYSWTGTPHESASVRDEGYIQIPNPLNSGDSFTVYAAGSWGGYGLSGTNRTFATDGSHWTLRTSSTGILSSHPSLSGASSIPVTNPARLWITFDSEQNVFTRGTRGNTYEGITTVPQTQMPAIRLGILSSNSGQHLNGHISAAIVYDRPLTEDEIARLDSIPTSELTWANIATPEMRVKQPGVGSPSLLLRPEGSYSYTPEDGVQEVTPDVVGDVQIVDGQYGKAWKFTDIIQRVNTSVGSRMNTEQGTVFVRVYIPAESTLCYPLSVNYTNGITLGAVSSASYAAWIGGSRTSLIIDSTRDHWVVIAARYNDGVGQFFLNGTGSGDGTVGTPVLGSTISIWGQTADRMHTTESVLIFNTALSDSDIQRISTMPEAWTMENVKRPDEVVRVDGMWTKRNGLLKSVELG